MFYKSSLIFTAALILFALQISIVVSDQSLGQVLNTNSFNGLSFQKAYVAEATPNVLKTILINKEELSKYITDHN